MNAKLLNPSRFLGGEDVLTDTTFTIKSITIEELETEEKGKTERKGQLMLVETPKPWLANVTNVKCIVAMFGDETDKWPGKRVTLHAERVLSFGEWVLGARVRGSPDIKAPISVSVKLRKKKTQTINLVPTTGGKAAAVPVVTFGKAQGWKDKPIADFDSATLEQILKEGEAMILATPTEKWVPGVQACLMAVKAALEAKVTAEPGAEG